MLSSCASKLTGDRELGGLRLGYTESQGDPGLRTTIADFYSRVTPDDVVVTKTGCEILSDTVPRSREAIEALMAA